MRPRHAASIYPFLLFLPPQTGRARGANLHSGQRALTLSMTRVKFRGIDPTPIPRSRGHWSQRKVSCGLAAHAPSGLLH